MGGWPGEQIEHTRDRRGRERNKKKERKCEYKK
jgi:hypothetical protein